MKWTKFLLLIAVFIATMFVIDRLYAPIPTWADKMLKKYASEKDSIEIVIIGNSHTGAIRQKKIDNMNVINLSYSGMELKERMTILKEVLQKKGPLKYVIMAMDYDQIGHKTSDGFLHNMLLPY